MVRYKRTAGVGFVFGWILSCGILAPEALAQETWRRVFDVEKGNLANVGRSPFTKVLRTRETTPLNPLEVSEKWYAEGIGMIGDEDLRLVKVVDPGSETPQP